MVLLLKEHYVVFEEDVLKRREVFFLMSKQTKQTLFVFMTG